MRRVQSTSRSEAIASGDGPTTVTLASGVDYRPPVSDDLESQGLSTGIATFQSHAGLPAHVHPLSEVIVPLNGEK